MTWLSRTQGFQLDQTHSHNTPESSLMVDRNTLDTARDNPWLRIQVTASPGGA
jgi:hypothetical protein